VAYEMGNSPQMVFKSYRELATPAEAECWFDVMPVQQDKKIIRLSNEQTTR
jgi:hypothetical protein